MTPTTPQTEHHIDVISKEKAVAFVVWMESMQYVKNANGFYHNQPPVAGIQVFFSLSELYDIFSPKNNHTVILSIPTKAQETYIQLCHNVYDSLSGIEYATAKIKAEAYGHAIEDICGTSVYGEILMAADRSFPENVETCGGIPFTFKNAK